MKVAGWCWLHNYGSLYEPITNQPSKPHLIKKNKRKPQGAFIFSYWVRVCLPQINDSAKENKIMIHQPLYCFITLRYLVNNYKQYTYIKSKLSTQNKLICDYD